MELLPRSSMHQRGQAHDTQPKHEFITRQKTACHNKGKNNFQKELLLRSLLRINVHILQTWRGVLNVLWK